MRLPCRPDPLLEPGQREVPCPLLSLVPAHQVIEEFGEASRRGAQETPRRQTPCYSVRGPAHGLIVHEGVSWQFSVAASDSQVRIIAGGYGNRSGSETEHTYRISPDGWISTIRAVSRHLACDMFPDWW